MMRHCLLSSEDCLGHLMARFYSFHRVITPTTQSSLDHHSVCPDFNYVSVITCISFEGSFKLSPTSEAVNATYVFSRKDLSRYDNHLLFFFLNLNLVTSIARAYV